jgi:LysM repeat protein
VQRDVKIGLSLGLLLVVVVATLFFRREPQAVSGPPALSDPESLNAALGERERGPYTLGEPEEFGTPPPAPPPSARTADAVRPARKKVPGLLASDDEDLHDRLFSGGAQGVPDPIPAPKQSVPPSLSAVDAPAGNGVRTHTIKAGDKLSNLAQKYLGSSNRFQELFEANKGVLKSPNSLPVGVTIVIPAKETPRPLPPPDTTESRKPASPAPHPAPESRAEEPDRKTETPSDADIRKRLFTPSRKGPFSSGRVGLPTRNAVSDVPRLKEESADETAPKSPLPRIDVQDQTDLLDPANESIRRPPR